jgi:hypothetical protein
MKTIEINGQKVEFYSSIKELPIDVRKKFDHYMIQDAGIGSSMEDVDAHLSKAFTFVANDKREDAMEELKNLRLNIFSMIAELNHKSLAFACLVARVDGQGVQDYSAEGLAALVEKLNITEQQVIDILEEVKKNLIPRDESISQNISGKTSPT